jgi:hypothetical protein
LGHVNNLWKEERFFYNYCIGLLVRFQTCQCQNWIFWLLLAVRSDLTSMSEIFFLKFSWWIQGWTPVVVFQQCDGVFILYPGVLLSQDGVDLCTNSQLLFPSTTIRLCLVGRPVVKPLYVFELLIESLNQAALNERVLPLELQWRVIDLPLPCGWWFIIPKPYLNFLLFKALTSYRLSGPLQCRLPVWCILAQFTKSWWHWSTTPLCAIPCVLWLHHIISINTQVHFSLDRECRYPMPPWVYPW